MSGKVVYFDNNATTAVAPEVLEAMLPFLKGEYGNPSSVYRFAGAPQRAVQLAREKTASILNAHPDDILFTSCGTESDATAIYAALQAFPEKKHFITTKVEHSALMALGQHIEKQGYRVTWLGVDSKGRIDLDELRQAISSDTAIVSIMFANNEIGNIYPIMEAAQICKERNVLFHTDAVQAVGKVAMDMETLPVDYLSFAGHKIHAPKGVGALYIRKGAPFYPYLRGGHQEKGRRAGTEAVPNVVALGAACELAAKHIEDENTRVKAMRDRLERELLNRIPDAIINGDPESRLPGTTNIAFKYVEGEAILLLLDQFGICASSGSACTSGSLEPSHVLRAMDVPFTFAHGSIRLSLGRCNSEEEVDYVLEQFPKIITRLREISPYRPGSEASEAVACGIGHHHH